MAMPIDLVLVRHGQSEGNLASKHGYRGDNKHFTKEFKNRHSSKWRLTDQGISEAKSAGKWIKENISDRFDRYYTSEHTRAMETSRHLDMPNATWFADFFLRERDNGVLESISPDERNSKYSEEVKRRELDSFYWSPPGGESIANLCIRLKWMLDTLHRECSDKKVIVVCHGEVIKGFRVLLERMPQDKFLEINSFDNIPNRINNCQVVHYTRRDPGTGKIMPYLGWYRSVCPWDESLSSGEWTKVERPTYSNQDLAKRVEKTKRIVND